MRPARWLLTALLAGALGLAHAAPRAWKAGVQRARIAVPEAAGDSASMVVQWFLPPGPGPYPVVMYSHGRDPSAAGRARIGLGIGRAQLQFWRARGVAVVVPLRPGYGASGGRDREAPGVHFDDAGRCVGHADFAASAEAAAQAISATLAWLRSQSWAEADEVLLVGQSVGGLATVAAAGRAPDGVVGYVNFAGGAGGNGALAPGASCDRAQLEALYADYGRATRVPSLWVYALDDLFWGAEAPRAWHAAFARGGSDTRFVQAPPVADGNGHELSAHAPALWAATVDEFLAKLGPPWDAATAPRPVLRLDASPSP